MMTGVNTVGAEPLRDMDRRRFLQGVSLSALAMGTGVALPTLAKAGTNAVREIENVWIPMSDGTRLAARIWLPEGAEEVPVPVIWNYCPYFKRSFTRPGDDMRFPWYAAHGYACVRVDIRGSGDSEGRSLDEYVQQEQDDALEVIDWMARQPWCSGNVGMEGISWSGINSLQVAARRPPALKAIITHCSTDDRFGDDAHYKGGCMLHDQVGWGAIFSSIQGQPSDPEITGHDGWMDRWIDRLDNMDLNLATWMEHQTRDDFWKHASVDENYADITCAVYAIGGWVDAYKNTVFRLLANLKAPTKGLVGPWTHIYPHAGVPGPAIGYLSEALRWWDHWLKGRDTGIMDEPKLRAWMQEKPAAEGMMEVPGRWVAEDVWPSPRVTEKQWYLNAPGSLDARSGKKAVRDLQPDQTVGLSSGNWCPSGGTSPEDLRIEMAQDQRLDDARSITFDTAPLAEDMEILGSARVELDVSVDKPVAYVIVRLNEVLPSGESYRATYGMLNLTHRNSHEFPEALEPGKTYRVSVPLDNVAQTFSAGNRIRVSISTTYWPMVLPSPEPVVLSVHTGGSRLVLPVRPLRKQDADLAPFGPPMVPDIAVKSLLSVPGERVVERDVRRDIQTIRHTGAQLKSLLLATGTAVHGSNNITYRIAADDPTSMMVEEHYVRGCEREGWAPGIDSLTTVTATKDTFRVTATLKAIFNGQEVHRRTWDKTIPRNLI